MAGSDGQAESKQQPASAVDESQQLKSLVDELCRDMENEVVDGNVADREDLAEICKVLKDISGKMTGKPEQWLLPQSKREELEKLLPLIESAFQRRRSSPPPPSKEDEAAAAADKKKKKKLLLPSCNPFINKARSSSASKQHKEEEQEEDDEGVSVKLLLRLAQNVLEPEQYYEWTTSYVDESRIYGWDKEADAVVDALIAPHPTEDDDGSSLLFRAAGIAGVHGSGKTALAQKVFVHDKAKDNFALRLWVCVGPPDSEDRFCLLYRMLDNLGLDTYKVEDIVDNSNAVKETVARIRADPARVAAIQKKAADYMTTHAQQLQHKTPDSISFDQLLREEADVESSKIGVLLYILHMTLSKTSYMIVFDDIREYGDDGWYRNLAQLPPADGQWGGRLGYGLPKGNQHRGAVLLTCRNEEHARNMVRTGRVFRPPKLELDDAWRLFKREYDQAKDAIGNNNKGEDMLFKELEQMKVQIVGKCLGLPVAIAEAAKGFAALDPLPDDGDDHHANKTAAAKDQTTPAGAAASSKSTPDTLQPATATDDNDDGPRPS
ncbi:hypothetical protein HU200_034798 [Digitaria exilis]|uniref:NB-ARC domain-containing protein n=1 Tax=Digitaria exilis TaxID=1010633 RepID=A0A835BG82_9POAL|nr:hypothetical protein HU200_034798 [Digitaria exilis]CAB3451660.1 unnamed protein product [Digitaria exilis]